MQANLRPPHITQSFPSDCGTQPCVQIFPSLLRRIPHRLHLFLQTKINPPTSPFYPECGVCDGQFNSWQAARQHAVAVGHTYPCQTCDIAWYHWDDAEEHMDEEDHWSKQHKFEACKWSFHTRGEARGHMQQLDHWRTYRCKPCNKGFENENNMRQVSNRWRQVAQTRLIYCSISTVALTAVPTSPVRSVSVVLPQPRE